MVNPKCFVYFLFKIKVVATAGECREKIISNCFRQESIDAVSAFVLQEAVHVGGAPPGRGVGSVHYLLICLCRGQVISRHKHPAQAARLQPPELGYLSLFCTINQLFRWYIQGVAKRLVNIRGDRTFFLGRIRIRILFEILKKIRIYSNL